MAEKKKRYEYKITLDKDWQGHLIRKSFYSTKSLADARRKAEKYRANYELSILCGNEEPAKKVLFKTWAIQALEMYKKPFVKGNTYVGTYLQPVRDHLIPHFGEVPLENILPIHVQNYVNKIKEKYKPETIKKDITVLSFIMQSAVENGLCRTNPVSKSIRLPKIERAEKVAYNQEQYDKVYEFAKNYPDGLSIMALLETGISRSELLGLRWEDFTEDGILHIRQGLVAYQDSEKAWIVEAEGLKNAYRCRDIPIMDTELLQRMKRKPRSVEIKTKDKTKVIQTEYIFHSPEGRPYQPNNWNNRVFLPFMRAMHERYPEIPMLSAHELRHTRATLWIAQGVDPMMAARLLGHSDTKMLMKIYDHTDVKTLRKALERSRREESKLIIIN